METNPLASEDVRRRTRQFRDEPDNECEASPPMEAQTCSSRITARDLIQKEINNHRRLADHLQVLLDMLPSKMGRIADDALFELILKSK